MKFFFVQSHFCKGSTSDNFSPSFSVKRCLLLFHTLELDILFLAGLAGLVVGMVGAPPVFPGQVRSAAD